MAYERRARASRVAAEKGPRSWAVEPTNVSPPLGMDVQRVDAPSAVLLRHGRQTQCQGLGLSAVVLIHWSSVQLLVHLAKEARRALPAAIASDGLRPKDVQLIPRSRDPDVEEATVLLLRR